MNDKTRNANRHPDTDTALSVVLRGGLIVSLTVVFLGGIHALWLHGGETAHYAVFVGEPEQYRHAASIFKAAFAGDSIALIQAGLLLLIVTPAVRVLACIIAFASQRDILYAALATFVFGVLVFSFFANG